MMKSHWPKLIFAFVALALVIGGVLLLAPGHKAKASSNGQPPSVVYIHATKATVTHFTVTGPDQNGNAATWSGNAINTTASAITEGFLWKSEVTISGYDKNNIRVCSGHGYINVSAEWYATYGANSTPLAVFGCY
jgi:hypothetical protein